jgi:glycosyltransferase involved in cell wall biosynthesis
MKLAVIIFAYNEERSIGSVIDGIPTFPDGVDRVDVIVVDDGCTDRTRAIALQRGAAVVSHATNRGLGAAFATGIDAALRSRADIIVSLDADGQHPPEAIPQLISPLLAGNADFATGTRFGDPALMPEMPASKRLGNWLVARVTSLVCGHSFTDATCGFRAYSRDAALRLNIFGRYTYTQEALVDLAHKGITAAEIPIPVRGVREHGESRVVSSLFHYAANTLTILARAARDRLPLAFFGAIGTMLSALGAAAELMVLVHFLITGGTTPYQSLIVLGAIFLILGAFSFLIALLADMLGRMRQTQETMLYLEKRRYYDELAPQGNGLDFLQDTAVLEHPLAAKERRMVLPLRKV